MISQLHYNEKRRKTTQFLHSNLVYSNFSCKFPYSWSEYMKTCCFHMMTTGDTKIFIFVLFSDKGQQFSGPTHIKRGLQPNPQKILVAPSTNNFYFNKKMIFFFFKNGNCCIYVTGTSCQKNGGVTFSVSCENKEIKKSLFF